MTGPRIDPYADLLDRGGPKPAGARDPYADLLAPSAARAGDDSGDVMLSGNDRTIRMPPVVVSKSAAGPRAKEVTALDPAQEVAFRQWADSRKLTDVDHPDSHYDYRGFWLAGGKDASANGHFPDTYKQHGHPTFSVESKYSTGADDGGHWEGDTFVPPRKASVTVGQPVSIGTPKAELDRLANAPDLKTRINTRLALLKQPAGYVTQGQESTPDKIAGAVEDLALAPGKAALKGGLYAGQRLSALVRAREDADRARLAEKAKTDPTTAAAIGATPDRNAATDNELAAAMGVATISDREGAVSAAQLAAMGLGPLAGKIAGKVTTGAVSKALSYVGHARYEPGSDAYLTAVERFLVDDAPTIAKGVGGTVQHGTTGALVGASFDPDKPARGAAIGATFGVAGNELARALDRGASGVPRAVEGLPETNPTRILPGRNSAIADVVPEQGPTPADYAVGPANSAEEAIAAARGTAPPPPAVTPEPVKPGLTPPEHVAVRVGPITGQGAYFERTGGAPVDGAVPYDLRGTKLADGTDPAVVQQITAALLQDPSLTDAQRAHVTGLQQLGVLDASANDTLPIAAVGQALGYDGLQVAALDPKDPPSVFVWHIRTVKPAAVAPVEPPAPAAEEPPVTPPSPAIPETVYHGTAAEFDSPRPTTGGQFGPGIYTTGDPAEAGRYAAAASRQTEGTPRVVPLSVSMKNPFVVDADVAAGRPVDWFKQHGFNTAEDPLNVAARQRLIDKGHDGVIARQPQILGVNDDGTLKLGPMQTHYIAFDASQVRRPAPASDEVAASSASAQAKPEKKQYDYASTQFDLPPEHAQAIQQLAATIPDEHLAEDGREDAPHITVKYGLHGNEPEKLRALLADQPPVTVTMGKTSHFPDSGSGDVVKVDIDSPALHALNKTISDALPHTDTHPGYKPHATVAYVKKGLGKQYSGDATLAGRTLTFDRLTFSGKDGQKVEIPLGGKPAPATGVPSVRGDEFGPPGATVNEVRKAALAHARIALIGKTFPNEEQGWPVTVSANAVEHAVRPKTLHPNWRVAFHALRELPELIRTATLAASEPTIGSPQKVHEVPFHHRLVAPLDYAGQRFTAEMTLREVRGQGAKKFYAIKALNVEPDAPAGGSDSHSPQPGSPSPGSAPGSPEKVAPVGPESNTASDGREQITEDGVSRFSSARTPSDVGPEASDATHFARAPGQGAPSAAGTPSAAVGGPPAISPPVAAMKVNKFADAAKVVFAPQSRTSEAGVMGRIVREHAAANAQALEHAREAMKGFSKSFDRMPSAERLAFIDRMETGAPQPTAGMTKAAAAIRHFLDTARDEIRALGTGKLDAWLENYFPHIWADPDAAKLAIGRILGRRPLEGPKSFLKHRTIPTTKEGMDAGLVPVTDNPVDLTLLKLREMRRYLAAHRILQEAEGRGIVKYVEATTKGPDGYRQVDDRIGTVYGKPTVTVSEAYDKRVRDGLEAAIARMPGLTHERKTSTGRRGTKGGLGYAKGTDEMVSKFGTDDGVIIHEFGHILDARYGLWQRLSTDPRVVKELRALAAERHAGTEATPTYRKYVQEPAEQIANALHALLHAPDLMARVAPTAKGTLETFIASKPELAPLLDIKPSLVLATGTAEVPVGGVVIRGHYWAPEPVTRVLNNYLSPGLRGNAIYDAYQGINNTLNQAQLGLSAFHLGFTSMDAAVSQVAVGLQHITHGRLLKGAGQIASYPAAPVTTFRRGSKLLGAYLHPETASPDLLQMVDAIVAAGGRARQDSFYATGAPKQLMEALRRAREAPMPSMAALARPSEFDDAVGTAVAKALPAITEWATRWIMEGVVPRQKLGVFMQLAERAMADLPATASRDEVRVALGRAWDSVDNRLGQLVYDNLFWDKTLKDALMASVRSVGWNLGTIRELGGGAKDLGTAAIAAGKGERPEMTERASYVIALTMVTMLMGAVLTKLLTGHGPKTLRDYQFIQTGRVNAEGNPERFQLPNYMKDVAAYAHDPVQTVAHKQAPLIGIVRDMLNNEDYYGDDIRNPDDPLVMQARQSAAYLAKQIIPFGVRNAQEAGKRVTDPRMAVGGFFGVTAAPRYATRTDAENKMMDYLAKRSIKGATPEQRDVRQSRMDVLLSARQGTLTDDALNAAESNGTLTARLRRNIERTREGDADSDIWIGRFKRLTADEALRVYKMAAPDEREKYRDVLERKLLKAGMDDELDTLSPTTVSKTP